MIVKKSEFVPFIHVLQPLDGSPSEQMREQQREDDRVRALCEKMLRDVREDVTKIEKDAYEKGFAQGKAQGEIAGRTPYENKVTEFEQLLHAIDVEKKDFINRHEDVLFLLIKAMADRLFDHELSVNPYAIRSCLKRAMGYVVENAAVKVRLHPDDFNSVKEASLEDPAFFNGSGAVQLMEDQMISRGGCILESDFGIVDANLAEFRDRLFSAVDKAFYMTIAEDGR